MSLSIVQLVNEGALDMEPIRHLFKDAFAGEGLAEADEVVEYLRGVDLLALSVGMVWDSEKGWAGLVILQNQPWVFSETAWMLHFYAPSAGAKRILLEWTRHWMEREGIETIRILNLTGRSDEAHMRLFREFAEPERVGGIIDYSLRSKA